MTDPIQPVEQPIFKVPTVGEGRVDMTGQPLDPNLPVDYQERFIALSKKPDFAETIFAHIANGGTLITLAQVWGVRYTDLSAYIGSRRDLGDKYNQALFARNEWEEERLLQELRAIATVDIRDAYKPDGTLKDIKDIPYNVAAALSSVEVDELFEGYGDERRMVGYTRKVKFWDKAKAIEMFMKKHGLLIERHKHEVTRTLEDLVGAGTDEVVEGELVKDAQAPSVAEPEQKNSSESSEATP